MSRSMSGRVVPFVPNPFGSTAFGSPWDESTADVPAINDGAFRTLAVTLRQLRAGARSTSIVITGEPGSGKTHLLGRLKSRLVRDEAEGMGETAYIYVRCNASAGTLWRHLRHALACDLLHPGADGVARLDLLLRRHADRLAGIRSLSLSRALECIRDGRHFHSASAWLRGELLTAADLNALGIAEDPDDEDRSRETDAKRVVDEFLRFIAPTPVVLCFDQVEGLQTYIGDENGFHAMGQMISALIDGHEHLLIISCIVAAFEDMFDRIPNGADRDRWLQGKATLRPIAWDQATQLVKARLDASPGLAPTRATHAGDPLWPIDTALLQPLFAATGLCLPRKLIQACRQQFDLLLGDGEPPPAPKSPHVFLRDEYQRSLTAARRIVQQQGADKTLTDCLPWLLQNSGWTLLGQDASRASFSHQGYRTSAGETAALAFCQLAGNQLTNRFKRIAANWKPGHTALRILRDPSVQPGALGLKILTALKAGGAKDVHPLPEALASLQAIRNLVATARSGELVNGDTPVGEAEVTGWALANLPAQVQALRDDLTGSRPELPDPVLPVLAVLMGERKIMDAEAAARALSLTPEEVIGCAHRHPMRFGVLGGPPLLLFHVVEGASRA